MVCHCDSFLLNHESGYVNYPSLMHLQALVFTSRANLSSHGFFTTEPFTSRDVQKEKKQPNSIVFRFR